MQKAEFRIIVVEDDDDTRNIIMTMLDKAGYSKISWAENGIVALEKINSFSPDLIICDWKMPQMDGMEVLKTVRKTPGYNLTSFLMLTAERQKHEVQKAIREGVNDYLIKPFKQEELSAKVNSIIEQKLLGSLR